MGAASLAFLALPVALFLAGWLRPALAACATALLAAGVLGWGHRLVRSPGPGEAPPVGAAALGVGALVVTAVVALNGAGGVGVQTWDWVKHGAILRDLVEQPWPVAYATGRDDVGLVYYVAYYLPAALVGALGGWRLANLALFAWTVVGAVLAWLWLVVLSATSAWRGLAMFVLFSGLDVVGGTLVSSQPSPGGWAQNFDLEWWARHWAYEANVTLLAYVPHQATGGWLLTGLVLDGLRRYPAGIPYLLVAAVGLLWSPFVTVGLLAVTATVLAVDPARRRPPGVAARDLADLAGGAIALALSLYFLSRYRPVALPEAYYSPPDRMLAGALGLVPLLVGWREFLSGYVGFALLEFGGLAALLAVAHRRRPADVRLLAGAALTLAWLPLLTYGYFNDLVMRASIPALFVLQILAVRAWNGPPGPALVRGALAGLLLVGAVYPANLLRLSARHVVARRALVRIAPPERAGDLFAQQLEVRHRYFYIGQYIGSLDSTFFRHLARLPVAVPKGPWAAR